MHKGYLMETSPEFSEVLTLKPRCPACAEVWVHVDSLTEFPEFSGWECPACGYYEIDP